ncbi:MAG: hypothetical protein MK179_10985 [Pirellulaceae bacterium]|nr:hypothetical protein [Pirellulaceae bacterium]
MIRKPSDQHTYFDDDTYDDYLESDTFTKIRRQGRTNMPVGASVSGNRGFHKTFSSRKVSQRISRSRGGKHRRRLKRWLDDPV